MNNIIDPESNTEELVEIPVDVPEDEDGEFDDDPDADLLPDNDPAGFDEPEIDRGQS